MQKRRDFIHLGGLGLLGLFAGKGFAQNVPIEPEATKSLEFKGWDKIKEDFSLDQGLTFLNNGTMGPSPKVVTNKVIQRITDVNSTGSYSGGDKECVKALASLTKSLPEEIALTHNVTEGVNIAAWGLPLKSGDEVILSTHEHVGNAAPWLNLARIKGVVIKAVPLGNSAAESLDIIKKAVTRKTRVIAVPHMPCTTGQVAPIKAISEFAKRKKICTIIDGAHGTGMLNLDLHDLGCDVYVSCCHKWLLGPKGTGYIYVRKDFLAELETVFSGAYSAKDWKISLNGSSFDGVVDTAHKYYFGTQNSALYFGVVEAVKYQQLIGSQLIEERVRFLNNMLYEGLEGMDNLKILTPKETESRCGVTSFRFSNLDNHKFYEACQKDRITVRYVAESDLDCVRISTHIYNSEADVDLVLKKIHSYV